MTDGEHTAENIENVNRYVCVCAFAQVFVCVSIEHIFIADDDSVR